MAWTTIFEDEARRGGAIPVHLVTTAEFDELLPRLEPAARRFAEAQGYKPEAGRLLVLPGAQGGIGAVLLGLGEARTPRSGLEAGRLVPALPPGLYRLEGASEDRDAALATLALALGAYRFERFKEGRPREVRFVPGPGIDRARIERLAASVALARDLVNTPANALGPAELGEAVEAVGGEYGAQAQRVTGEALAQGFPMIQAVGAGSDRAPLLIDMAWGRPDAPKVTLVGKGVVFDTGGLDIKPASGMLLMKKDMGGAANVLALARMVMDAGLDIRLRLLVPAVENAISGRALRPGDVLRSRKGLSVEIGNTDAEGRLVLADALSLADEEAPDLLVSMATLTGAARVALGPDLPPFYTEDERLAAELTAAAEEECDPVWRMPFWAPYDGWLASKVADLNNIAPNAYAGSVVAALFLKRFVERAKSFAHFDIFAWVPTPKPHAPEGGEAQAIRALFRVLEGRYGRA